MNTICNLQSGQSCLWLNYQKRWFRVMFQQEHSVWNLIFIIDAKLISKFEQKGIKSSFDWTQSISSSNNNILSASLIKKWRQEIETFDFITNIVVFRGTVINALTLAGWQEKSKYLCLGHDYDWLFRVTLLMHSSLRHCLMFSDNKKELSYLEEQSWGGHGWSFCCSGLARLSHLTWCSQTLPDPAPRAEHPEIINIVINNKLCNATSANIKSSLPLYFLFGQFKISFSSPKDSKDLRTLTSI